MGGLTWAQLVQELGRADLLSNAPAVGPEPRALGVDSRSVERGTVYIAVRGSQADGHRFVADAVGRGASAVIVETPQKSGVPEIVVRDSRRAALVLGAAWYGHPGRSLTLIGVTGTNGKTTTTGLIRHLLNRNQSAGSIGTVGAFDGAEQPVPSTAGSLTTPGPIDLQATLAALQARGVTHVAMETSSHSLDQGRLDGLSFAAAVFTNLTRDHLDYHGTMEAYLAAKLRLSALLRPTGVEVVNLDDDAWSCTAVRAHRADHLWAPSRSRRPGHRGQSRRARHPPSILSGRFGSAEALLPLAGRLQRQQCAGRRGHGARAGAVRCTRSWSRLATAPQVPGRMERIADTALHGAARLRPHARRTRAGAAALAAHSHRDG